MVMDGATPARPYSTDIFPDRDDDLHALTNTENDDVDIVCRAKAPK